MTLRKIRWRLPLSYAAIALLTALVLGVLLLTTLRSYYRQLELEYLAGNATAISSEIGPVLAQGFPQAALRSQLSSFAFLSQTRVRVLDQDGNIIVDSGPPFDAGGSNAILVESILGDVADLEARMDGTLPDSASEGSRYQTSILIVNGLVSAEIEEQTVITRDEVDGEETVVDETQRTVSSRLVSRFPVAGTPFGFGLSSDVRLDGPRSNLVVKQAITDVAGRRLGYVELSQGPAYGRDILRSVAWGWGIASGTAVLLAATAGWFMSLQLSTPLLTLTDVTTRMAEGDLSARAEIDRQDELGTLAHSFNRMAAQVEETVTTLRRFVADAAHELHTPLTALRTDLELIGQDLIDEAQRDKIRRAENQVTRLEAMTTGLLDLSRLEANGSAKRSHPVDLGQLVRSASEQYASRAEQAGLMFSLDLPESGINVQGDDSQLRQAVDNLLDNAVKFTPEGGSVSIKVEKRGELAAITVSDTGIGVPEHDMVGLFGRFHRGRNATGYPGSGLGLAIVKAIMDRHGGSVRMSPDPEGTHFTLCLPIIGTGASQ